MTPFNNITVCKMSLYWFGNLSIINKWRQIFPALVVSCQLSTSLNVCLKTITKGTASLVMKASLQYQNNYWSCAPPRHTHVVTDCNINSSGCVIESLEDVLLQITHPVGATLTALLMTRLVKYCLWCCNKSTKRITVTICDAPMSRNHYSSTFDVANILLCIYW